MIIKVIQCYWKSVQRSKFDFVLVIHYRSVSHRFWNISSSSSIRGVEWPWKMSGL